MRKLLVIAALLASSAQATPTFFYAEQGVGFLLDQTDANSLTLRIKGILDATGDWADATQLSAVGFKNLGFDPTGGTVNPGDWSWSPKELTANGCAGGDSGGVCFETVLALTNDMTFQFDLTGGVLDLYTGLDPLQLPHLKLRVLDAQGNKEGTLLSHSLAYLPPGSPDPFIITVPEPTSLALTGLGLLGLGAFMRKRREA